MKNYNKSLEIDVQTLKDELKSILEKYRREKSMRKAAEESEARMASQLYSLQTELNKLNSKPDNRLYFEKEKVKIDSRLDKMLQSNNDLLSKIDSKEEEIKRLNEERYDQKIFDEHLKRELNAMKERV
jgi:chromosome segregation ATPase